MAELARKIYRTCTSIGQQVRKLWIEAQDIECEVVVFSDLNVGDKFIIFPTPGDNHGHGGFLSGGYLFQKITPVGDANEPLDLPYFNAVKVCNGDLTHISDKEWIYKVH